MYTVVTIEDRLLTRLGIIATVEAMFEATIVGQSDVGDDIIKLVEEHRPDLVLLDIKLENRDGTKVNTIQEIHNILRVSPRTKIVIVSAFLNYDIIHTMFENKVNGYILKDDFKGTPLPKMILQALKGHRVISPQVLAFIEERKNSPAPELTPRKVEVLLCLAMNYDTPLEEIGQILGIQEQSVKNHLNIIYSVFGVSSRTGCILKGIELGYIHPDQWRGYQDE